MLDKIKSIFKRDKINNILTKNFDSLTSPFYALVVADGHGTISRFLDNFMEDIDKVDIIFYLGDLELKDFVALNNHDKLNNVDYGIGVVGNHDSENDLYEQGIEDIHDRLVTFNGISILGIRGSFKYKDVEGPMMTDEESESFVEDLPDCDILITHDWSKHEEIGNTAHKGMSGITKYIKEHSPVCHLHGHIHQYSSEKVGNTISYSFFKLAYIKVTRNGIEIIKAYGK